MTTEKPSAEIVPAAPVGITPVMTGLEDALSIREDWVKQREQELATAEEGLKRLEAVPFEDWWQIGMTEVKLEIMRRDVSFLRQVVKTMQSGYVPIPRFEGQRLNLQITAVPLKALVAITKAAEAKLFHQFQIVEGLPRPALAPPRDPIVVGIVTGPDVGEGFWVTPVGGSRRQKHYRTVAPRREEHFMVAWWRPEDVRPGDTV